jgi:hypothetical protein
MHSVLLRELMEYETRARDWRKQKQTNQRRVVSKVMQPAGHGYAGGCIMLLLLRRLDTISFFRLPSCIQIDRFVCLSIMEKCG